jgi:hypothetical protein
MKAKITFVEETPMGEKIVREEIVSDDSFKRMTKGRAAKIISRHYPGLRIGNLRVMLVDTDKGWLVVKANQVRKNVWLKVYISEAE